MQVSSLETFVLSHDVADGPSFGDARGWAGAREAALVRVETDDGIVGWGEAFAPARTVTTLIEEVLADAVVGMDPYAVKSFAERTMTGELGAYHFGGGPFMQSAVSGVDIALWDVLGKASGRPVHQLLGGNRDAVVPYASTGYISDEWSVESQLREAVDEGYTAAKIKIGRGVDDDVARVAAAREVLGDDATLMVDYNGNYAPKQALRSIRELEPYDIAWVEEPVPPENFQGYRQVTPRIDVPVAAGEAHFNRAAFRTLIDERLVDVVQPNVCHVGGFSEAEFVVDLATTANVTVRPHVWNSGVGTAAALQLLGSVPDYPHSHHVPDPVLFEFDRSPNPLRTDLLVDPLDPTGGTLAVPDDPGLGVEVDEAAVERYRVDT